ncbi:MAG: hypothetical protein OXU23_01330 [Candidatus Poribacteria bacterium]|nr:hypothetical protein [Candidatus Poribacteria bacterium]
MRTFRQAVIYILMLLVFIASITNGVGLSGFEAVIIIYGGFFLLILDEALSFLKEKL